MYTSRSYPACGTHGVTCKQCIECQDLGSETQAAPLTYITLALYRVTTKWETHRQLANRSTKRGSDKKWLKQSRTATGRESILCNGCVSRVECENEWTQKKNLKNKQTQEPAQGVFFRRFLQVTIVELILRKRHDPDKPWNIWEFEVNYKSLLALHLHERRAGRSDTSVCCTVSQCPRLDTHWWKPFVLGV